jgi:hypothetical protein
MMTRKERRNEVIIPASVCTPPALKADEEADCLSLKIKQRHKGTEEEQQQ